MKVALWFMGALVTLAALWIGHFFTCGCNDWLAVDENGDHPLEEK